MKTLSKTILTVLATGIISCGLLSQQAQAVVVVPSFDTLADLSANPNNSIRIGDKVFSNFSFVATNLTLFDANLIIVTASFDPITGTYFLTYGGNISATGIGAFAGDLLLNYRVTATAGSIFMIDQLYTGSATPGSFLAIDETARVGASVVAHSHLDFILPGDFSDPPAEANDVLDINPPQSVLNITKDIALSGPVAGFVTVSQVSQSFHQTVPDGGSAVALLGIALAGIEGARRILRARKG